MYTPPTAAPEIPMARRRISSSGGPDFMARRGGSRLGDGEVAGSGSMGAVPAYPWAGGV
jgi:hypothetical protein